MARAEDFELGPRMRGDERRIARDSRRLDGATGPRVIGQATLRVAIAERSTSDTTRLRPAFLAA